MRRILHAWLAAALGLVLVLAACSSPSSGADDHDDATPTPSAGNGEDDGGDEGEDSGSEDEDTESEPAEEALPWGPTPSEVQEATEIASEMSDDELAGQVIIARYGGTDPAIPAALVADYNLAGVILFTENVTSAAQVRETAEAVQDAHADLGREWPAAISVDNEGGLVQRMSGASGEWTTYPPFAAAGAVDDDGVISEAYAAMGNELRGSGVTMNFAPVADVSIGAQDPTINLRAAGSDPEVVSSTVQAALDGFAEGGVLTSIKHFPGHGSMTVDSHEELPVQTASSDELAQRDLVPFEAGIEAGAPMVMMGHIAVQAWDEGEAASMSPQAYRVLREDLGFTGVAITDGLDMGALTADRTPSEIAVDALDAGADILLTPQDVPTSHAAVVAALEDGSLDREQIEESAGRVIAMQQWQQTIADEAPAVDLDDVGSAGEEVAALRAAAVTQVTGECERALVGDRLHVQGGTTDEWNAFAAAAQEAGLQVVALEEPADTTVRLIASGGSAQGGDVAVALAEPWDLQGADAATLFATNGGGAGSMSALVDALTGEVPAPGRLGFAVGDLPASACD